MLISGSFAERRLICFGGAARREELRRVCEARHRRRRSARPALASPSPIAAGCTAARPPPPPQLATTPRWTAPRSSRRGRLAEPRALARASRRRGLERPDALRVSPTPATHSILQVLKTGETVYRVVVSGARRAEDAGRLTVLTSQSQKHADLPRPARSACAEQLLETL